ncbi:MAG: DPP IV N-terminal domain-containing protein, partial [Pseudoalteromonas rhizosphaerae]
MIKTSLALALGLSSSLAFAATSLTVEDIPKIQSVIQTSISPDGDNVAFTRSVPRELYVDENGANYSELYVVDDEGVERPFITGSVNIKSIQWSNDSKTIYFLAKLKDDKFTALYQIPVDGGQAQKVLSLKDTSISSYQLSPNNKQLAILAMPAADKSEKELKKLGFMAEVYELGLKDKQLFIVDLAKTDKPLTPTALNVANYVSDVNWAAKGDKLLVKT